MLDIPEQIAILNTLIQDSHLQHARLLSYNELKTLNQRGVIAGVEGKIKISGQEICLWIGINDSFPLSLPMIFLQPADALGKIPHLEEDGYLCYLDTEGLYLDFDYPVDILIEAIKLATNLLKASIKGENQWDFMDEFQAYWYKLNPQSPSLPTFLSIDNTLRKIYAYKKDNCYVLVADKIDTACAYFNYRNQALHCYTRYTALYIPLESGTFLNPPTAETFWSISYLRQIIRKYVSAENYEKLKQYRVRKNKSEELVILGVPRPKAGMILIGLIFSAVGDEHPLIASNSTTVPLPINIQRYDSKYLLSRAGGKPELNKTKALIVGCGSIGGHIPYSLVQAGNLLER